VHGRSSSWLVHIRSAAYCLLPTPARIHAMTASEPAHSFVQTAAGLYVPAGVLDSPTGKRRSSEDRYRRSEVRAMVIAAFCGVLGLVLSLSGVYLGYRAFNAQQDFNLAQQQLIDAQQNRQDRRYAERVTWFDQHALTGEVLVRIYNRAPVVLDAVQAYMFTPPGPERAHLSVGMIPSCTAVVIELPQQVLTADMTPLGTTHDWHTNEIEFEDAVGYWRSGYAGPELIRKGKIFRGADVSAPGPFYTVGVISRDKHGVPRSKYVPVRLESLSDCAADA
jgi:hypothetical protein